MYLKSLIENKFTVLSSVALILVPYYTWKSLYNSYRNFKRKYDEELLFYKRHNCVVMYTGLKGMSGWPPHMNKVKVDITKKNCLDGLREPIIYFINTAKKSLDLAIMLINVNAVYNALIKAQQRGIKVRVLLNFEHCDSKLDEIRSLIKEGIEVLIYISQGMTSIMHYKYIVKDYDASGGYVFTGSLNLTDSGLLNNYEDVVITSNHYVVKAFHKNFQQCWDFVKADNEDIFNKTTLLDANLM